MRQGTSMVRMRTDVPTRILGRAMAVAAAVLALSGGLRAAQLSESVRNEALRVIRDLTAIEAESPAGRKGAPRRLDFTESELNSYVAYRIAAEKESVMDELKLKVFAENRVEGMIGLDFRGQRLPGFLKERMTLYFEGILTTQDGRAKLGFQKLFLEGQPIPVAVLDIVIYIAAKMSKSEPSSINDWYALPYGIREIRTGPQRLSVFY